MLPKRMAITALLLGAAAFWVWLVWDFARETHQSVPAVLEHGVLEHFFVAGVLSVFGLIAGGVTLASNRLRRKLGLGWGPGVDSPDEAPFDGRNHA